MYFVVLGKQRCFCDMKMVAAFSSIILAMSTFICLVCNGVTTNSRKLELAESAGVETAIYLVTIDLVALALLLFIELKIIAGVFLVDVKNFTAVSIIYLKTGWWLEIVFASIIVPYYVLLSIPCFIWGLTNTGLTFLLQGLIFTVIRVPLSATIYGFVMMIDQGDNCKAWK